MLIFISLLIWVALIVICVFVARGKGRNPWLWGILGFLFSFITLIVIAALPGRIAASVRHCPQCDAENDLDNVDCAHCGASLAPEVAGRGVTPERFVTPFVGLASGLVFVLILLQATTPSAESMAENLFTRADSQQLREHIADIPPVVLFWPVSPGLQSLWFGAPVAVELWPRLPITLEITVMGGGLAVLLAWGLGLGLRHRHPGVTAGRMSISVLAAVPVFWFALVVMLVLVHVYDYLPPLGYAQLWEDPKTNLVQLFWPTFAIGITGGLWIALEMRSRGDASAKVVFLRA